MQNTSSRHDHHLLFKIGLIYGIVTALVCTALFWLNHQKMSRLAQSYGRASRHSLMIGDLRQAVSSLLPAVNGDFSSISMLDSGGRTRLNLPNDRLARETDPFTSVIELPVSSDPDGPSQKPTGQLIFRYSFRNYLIYLALSSLLILMGFVLIYQSLRRRIIERERFHAHQLQVDFQKRLTLQVAHDIRSPLSALNLVVTGSTDIPDLQRSLIQSAADRINGIANDLLSLDRPRPEVKSAPDKDGPAHNLYEALSKLIDEKTLGIGAKRLNLSATSNRARTLRSSIDRTDFDRVLSNLINNALEAVAESGEVSVSISEDGDKAIIQIMDNGRGIPSHILKQLGTERVSLGKESSTSGSGLGVLHARQTIEKHRGTLRIESREGRGTLVTITLPAVHEDD